MCKNTADRPPHRNGDRTFTEKKIKEIMKKLQHIRWAKITPPNLLFPSQYPHKQTRKARK